MMREVSITSEGSGSVVVWNPWTEKAASMGDMHEEGYREFVCVETANALNDAVTLQPSERHTLKMSVEY
jgi:D-hexose-6-phosphate mutarotase